VVWQIAHLSFNLATPMNITNLFGSWFAGVGKKERAQIRVGACAFLWRFGMCEMIIFLTEPNKILLCKLSLWLHIGFVCGLLYNQWTSDIK
jgi:hypothetical protein